jgi:DNA-binding transcriptional MerR regulator
VKPYVLRYWEQEFTQLKPMKRRGNRRYYQHHEVLLIRRIRELLYEHGFTISGARNRLADSALAGRGALGGAAMAALADLGDLGDLGALRDSADAELDESTPEPALDAPHAATPEVDAAKISHAPLNGAPGDSLIDATIDPQADLHEPEPQGHEAGLSGLHMMHSASAVPLQRQERALLRAELLSIRELLTV